MNVENIKLQDHAQFEECRCEKNNSRRRKDKKVEFLWVCERKILSKQWQCRYSNYINGDDLKL